MVVVTVVLFVLNVELALITLLGRRAAARRSCRCGSGARPTAGYMRVRDGIAGVLSRPLREPVGRPRRRRLQPPAPQRAPPPQRRRRVPRRQRLHRAGRRRSYGAGDRVHRPARAGDRCCSIGGTHGAATATLIGRRADRVHPLPQRVLPADPAARAAVQPVPAGPGGDRSSSTSCSPTQPTRRGGADAPVAAADRGRDRARRRLVRRTTRRTPVLRDVDLHIAPGETIVARRRRPAPASRPSPSSSRASTTRPRGSVAHRRPRPARRHASSRCAASSASCRRSRSCSPAPIRDNIAFARPDATDDEVDGGRATRSGSTDLVDAAPRRPRHARPRARRRRCRRASAS